MRVRQLVEAHIRKQSDFDTSDSVTVAMRLAHSRVARVEWGSGHAASRLPMITLPIVNYDNNQHAADENLRIQNLWDGIETYVALLSGMGKSWGQRPIP